MKENMLALYFNMILGTIGTILVALTALGYLVKTNDGNGYIIIFLGFIFTISYINFLEKRAGVSKKLTWIRAIVSIVIFASISYFYF
ncbi:MULTISPECIES: hypothetical protein [Heyndrickxia]|uniref:Uncharacterized protein n=1 Tax=Heyndrickxia sporothermodurans TaxID=46224 RepID=A0A150KZS2_9BACI|nr:hypothetical protein [Heyndrickxia sporothermodurans]KYD05474.1 hypothetical protein B4102_3198 [Heyndrickxia sporothermodurans]MBL5766366.1 hypothetical protein [Heyndrickxia sporothermodurans]MBL5769805.1 hypothetical protein [Heyndrickxia sporothermodurans]MBL5773997.1 hypothetical protein [Heyndrickxia sporothermodurans]MBL5776885.1 hypothetical protein [Heyndrickxia sporothermodurans]